MRASRHVTRGEHRRHSRPPADNRRPAPVLPRRAPPAAARSTSWPACPHTTPPWRPPAARPRPTTHLTVADRGDAHARSGLNAVVRQRLFDDRARRGAHVGADPVVVDENHPGSEPAERTARATGPAARRPSRCRSARRRPQPPSPPPVSADRRQAPAGAAAVRRRRRRCRRQNRIPAGRVTRGFDHTDCPMPAPAGRSRMSHRRMW